MSVCEEIQKRATYLAALAGAAPERVEAFAHAQTCLECRKALEEGAQIVSLLDAMPLPAAPSVEVLARASSSILAELAAAAAKRQRQPSLSSLVLGASVLASCLVFVAMSPLSHPELWPMALAGVLLVSLLSGVLPRQWWAVALLGAGSVGLSALHAEAPWQGRGMLCLWTEHSMALVPLATSLYLVAKGHLRASSAYFAGAAAAGALAGQATMLLACPNNNLEHLLLAHTGGVLFAAAMGALVSKLWTFSPSPVI